MWVLEQVDILPLEDFNPYGNGFTYSETNLTTEKVAQRVTNAETARIWKIKNPAQRSAITGAANPADFQSQISHQIYDRCSDALITTFNLPADGMG